VVKNSKLPIYSEDDDSFLGFVIDEKTSWRVVTIFDYLISRAATQKEAEATLQDLGPNYLKGMWHYYDKDDKEWFPCVIKKAFEQRVIVNRTNNLGYQDPDDYKQVVIENPTENDLIKSS
jgi:hypothetical protein